MPDTDTGYHAPDGGEVVEPSPPDDGDPTDVAILAASIENAHSRAEYGQGASHSSPTNSALPPGALYASAGAVTYTLVSGAVFGGANTAVKVSDAGLYRVVARFSKSGVAGSAWSCFVAAGTSGAPQNLASGGGTSTTIFAADAVVRLAANDEIWAAGSTSADPIRMAHLFVQRVSP
jgi:hypothetical protein